MAEESALFYYAGSEKVPLELADDAVIVALDQPISERRLALLDASDHPVAALARSPALLDRGALLHQPGPAMRGPERLAAFAARLSRAPSVRFVSPVLRDPASGQHLIALDEILVRFKPDATEEQIAELHAHYGVEPVEQKLYAPNQYVLRVLDPTTRRVLDVANGYHENELVEWAAPNFWRERETFALELAPFQWHLNNTGQNTNGQGAGVTGEDVHAHAAWEISTGSGNVTIAILDSGVDVGHPGLRSNIAPFGRSFDGDDPNNPNPVNLPPDVIGHGTACAGVAAGNGGKISGIAPGCMILPIRMLRANDNGAADAIHYAAQHAQILSNSWGPQSFDPAVDQAIRDVIASGRQGKGTIVVFAAGNHNKLIGREQPARIPGVIAVGGATNVGSRSGYSNFGDDIDAPNADPLKRKKRLSVLASTDGTSSNRTFRVPYMARAKTEDPDAGPFEDDNSTECIYTTDIQGQPGYNPLPTGPGMLPSMPQPAPVRSDFDYNGLFGGTSSACPLAAGICALMLSVNADLTVAQVKYILEATADKIGTGTHRIDVPDGKPPAGKQAAYDPISGYDTFKQPSKPVVSRFGFGRANAAQAVKAAQGRPIQQLLRDAAGNPSAIADEIVVELERVGTSNRFVSKATIELVDARRDALQLTAAQRLFVRGGPGGFLRASFQPSGGGPAVSDEADVEGQPTL